LALPTDHALNGSGVDGLLDEADVVLALDVDDLRGPLGHRLGDGGRAGDVTLLNVGVGALKLRGWSQDYQALVPARLQVTATADRTVEGLVARLRAAPVDGAAERGAAAAARIAASRREARARAAAAGADGAVALERL